MKIGITRHARGELLEMVANLEQTRPSAGHRLRREFRIVLDNLRVSPQMCAPTEDGVAGIETRNAIIERYKVRVIYVCGGSEVRIVSILHGHRRPGAWHSSPSGV